ncbi:MAG: carbohydrate ABC transporter substrate-binding protein [Puniceicoccaceae bacterium]|nr:MAG: carbohydrate ABC transporter substrate-binding protein [Puniceicoccaceae bacterium]
MTPRTEATLNWIGAILLLLCFVIALGRVATRVVEQADPDTKLIRFAHWQLEPGLRDAFDSIAREYERRTPGVRVEQIAVPERVYTQWLRTRLVGGDAPQLIQWGIGASDELLARFFEPLTPWLQAPNPYNQGTDLEGVPWRETFLDGLSGTFNQNLLENYQVSTSMFTIRMFYNQDLWRKIFGEIRTPETYEEFIVLLQEVEDYARRTGEVILPIAGSRVNAPFLFDNLYASQTQRLVQELDAGRNLGADNTDMALALLRGEWSLEGEASKSGFRLMRSIGRYFTPGFLQLQREDMVFYFVQGRALMASSGSWDSPSLRQQAHFPIGVFVLPLPSAEHPEYGRFLLGQQSETVNTQGPFGMVRGSDHEDQVIDFLQFLTSKEANQIFVNESGWLPSIRGVEPTPMIEPFMPIRDGYVPGVNLTLNNLGGDTSRLFQTNLHELFTPGVSIDRFASTYQREMLRAVRSDLERRLRNDATTMQRADTVLPALRALAQAEGSEGDAAGHAFRYELLLETQIQQEYNLLRLEYELAATRAGS